MKNMSKNFLVLPDTTKIGLNLRDTTHGKLSN